MPAAWEIHITSGMCPYWVGMFDAKNGSHVGVCDFDCTKKEPMLCAEENCPAKVEDEDYGCEE